MWPTFIVLARFDTVVLYIVAADPRGMLIRTSRSLHKFETLGFEAHHRNIRKKRCLRLRTAQIMFLLTLAEKIRP